LAQFLLEITWIFDSTSWPTDSKDSISFRLDTKTHEYTFKADLLIIEPTDENIKAPRPPLLGRDVINRWCFLYDQRAGILDIDPTSWCRLEPIRRV
ncbi:MAG TPA: hypothetical protein VMB34_28980, partial [Acetobacteraceae bacterium]|nr:hypothetical protein [Acetobacteraceae bacterium]